MLTIRLCYLLMNANVVVHIVCFPHDSMVALINNVSAKLKRGLYLTQFLNSIYGVSKSNVHKHAHIHIHNGNIFLIAASKHQSKHKCYVFGCCKQTHLKNAIIKIEILLMQHFFIILMLPLRTEDSLTCSNKICQ